MGKRRSEKDEPNLELPSFFRRRNRRAAEPQPADEPAQDPHEASEADEPASPEPPDEPAPPEVPAETEAPAAEPAASRAEPGRRVARQRRTTPLFDPRLAAAVTGVLVGAAGTLLTWGALAGCEVLRGTDSCGGPGLLVLVAILVLMVVAGALLLKALKVAEASSTSFLGTGLMTVVVMVALLEAVFSSWMFVVVPLLTGVSFLAAWWVSTRFVDTEEERPSVDVR